ncbi:MAG: efflux RND transporter periplasmic adaptor subunit, partial [Planctomycetota bacterium]
MKITIIVLLTMVVLVVGGALLAGPDLTSALGSFKSEPTGTLVRTMPVEPSSLVETVSAPGEVEPHTRVDVSAEVSARIEQLPYREGDGVRKGDIIVKLDDRDLKAMLESSRARHEAEQFRLRAEQASLEGLRSTLSFARKQLERKQTLFDSGDVSRKELDDAIERVQDLVSSVDSANHRISVIESSLAAAQADIDQSQDALDNTVILAPMDGTITALNMEVGEQVLGTFNNMGSTIMTIADLSRMIMRAEVAESDIASIQDGQQARIYINAYPDETFMGTVTEIALQRTMSSDGTGIFETEIEIDLQGRRIRSGLTANVDIEIATHEGLVVESQAIVDRLVDDLPVEIRKSNPLVSRGKRTTSVLYTLVDGKAVCSPVRAGPSDLTHTLVSDGLHAGDIVVIGPYKVLEK